MNKGFGTVWNQVRGTYMVVSELAKSQGKKATRPLSYAWIVGFAAITISMPLVWGGQCTSPSSGKFLCTANLNANEFTINDNVVEVTINGFNGGLYLLGKDVTATSFCSAPGINCAITAPPISGLNRGNGVVIYPVIQPGQEPNNGIKSFTLRSGAMITVDGNQNKDEIEGMGLVIGNGNEGKTTVKNEGLIKLSQPSLFPNNYIIYLYKGKMDFTQTSSGEIYGGISFINPGDNEGVTFNNDGKITGNIYANLIAADVQYSTKGNFENTNLITGNIDLSGQDLISLSNTGKITGNILIKTPEINFLNQHPVNPQTATIQGTIELKGTDNQPPPSVTFDNRAQIEGLTILTASTLGFINTGKMADISASLTGNSVITNQGEISDITITGTSTLTLQNQDLITGNVVINANRLTFNNAGTLGNIQAQLNGDSSFTNAQSINGNINLKTVNSGMTFTNTNTANVAGGITLDVLNSATSATLGLNNAGTLSGPIDITTNKLIAENRGAMSLRTVNIRGADNGSDRVTFVNAPTGVLTGDLTFNTDNLENPPRLTFINAGQTTYIVGQQGDVNLEAFKSNSEFIVKPGSDVVGVTSLGTLNLDGTSGNTIPINHLKYRKFRTLTVSAGDWQLFNPGAYTAVNLKGGILYFGDPYVLNDAKITIPVNSEGSFQTTEDNAMVIRNEIEARSLLKLGGDYSLNLSGEINAYAGLVKSDDNTISIGAQTSITGGDGITVNKGALAVLMNEQYSLSTSHITVADGAQLQLISGILLPTELNGNFIEGTGTVSIGQDTNSIFTIQSNNDIGIASDVVGPGSLIKSGTERLTFKGNANYLGKTEVQSGTVVLNHPTTSAGLVNITEGSSYTLDFVQSLDNSPLSFKQALIGKGNFNINFAQADDQFAFKETVGTAFEGKVSMGRGKFILDNVATEVLKKVPLELRAASYMYVDSARTISSLILNQGTLGFNIVNKKPALFTASTIDLTQGGTMMIDIDTIVSGANAVSLFDQSNNPQLQLLSSQNPITPPAINTPINFVNKDNQALSSEYSVNLGPGPDAKAIYEFSSFISDVYPRGLWLNYNLQEINLQEGRDFTLSDSGAISHTFNARVTGNGNIILAPTAYTPLVLANMSNDYSGITTIQTGKVQLNANNALGNTAQLSIKSGATLDMNDKTQSIGILDIQDKGTLDIKLGTIILNGSSSFSRGKLLGAGTLNLQGGQLTIVADNSAFTGSTKVAGLLTVNGRLGGSLTVSSGGRLQGTGSVGTTSNSGTLAPGNSIGTLNIMGDLMLDASSIFEVEINPAGESDKVSVSGTATVGGQLSILRKVGSYTAGQRYTLITATVGIEGQFISPFLQNLPISLKLIQDAKNIYLEVVRSSSDLADKTLGGDQAGEAIAIEKLGENNPLYQAIVNLPNAQAIQAALSSLSGEIFASTQAYLLDDSHHLRDMSIARMHNLPRLDQGDQAPAVWGQAYSARGNYSAFGQSAPLNHRQNGVFVGTDSMDENSWRVGMIGGYAQTTLTVDARNSTAVIDTYHLGLYSGIAIDKWNFRVGGAYSWYKVDTQRQPEIGAKSYSNTVQYDANTMQFFGELGYEVRGDSFSIEPFVNVAYVQAKNASFQEVGSMTALSGLPTNYTALFSTIALRANKTFAFSETSSLAIQGNVGWRYTADILNPAAQLAFAGSTTFDMHGSTLAEGTAVVGLGINVKTGKNVNIELNYASLLANEAKEHSAQMNVIWKFE